MDVHDHLRQGEAVEAARSRDGVGSHVFPHEPVPHSEGGGQGHGGDDLKKRVDNPMKPTVSSGGTWAL